MTNIDVKEAALNVVLDRLEQIDADSNTRAAFAANAIMATMHQMDKPMFEPEITLLRQVLGRTAKVSATPELPSVPGFDLEPRGLETEL